VIEAFLPPTLSPALYKVFLDALGKVDWVGLEEIKPLERVQEFGLITSIAGIKPRPQPAFMEVMRLERGMTKQPRANPRVFVSFEQAVQWCAEVQPKVHWVSTDNNIAALYEGIQELMKEIRELKSQLERRHESNN